MRIVGIVQVQYTTQCALLVLHKYSTLLSAHCWYCASTVHYSVRIVGIVQGICIVDILLDLILKFNISATIERALKNHILLTN